LSAWIAEAQKLLRLAARDLQACDALLLAPGLDEAVAAFHAQQAAEKALKTVLVLKGLEARRTHDLEELASRLERERHVLPVTQAELTLLTPYAVEFRYEEGMPTLLTGNQARRMACALVDWATALLERGEY
jgi:HEPN domain-containing protein